MLTWKAQLRNEVETVRQTKREGAGIIKKEPAQNRWFYCGNFKSVYYILAK